MSRQHNGLQSSVRSKYEYDNSVHYYAHVFVLKKSVEYIRECKIFFLTLSGSSSFFSTSIKRVHALDNLVERRFPTVAPTRWNYNSRLIEMKIEHKLDVKNQMESLIENTQNWDSDFVFY